MPNQNSAIRIKIQVGEDLPELYWEFDAEEYTWYKHHDNDGRRYYQLTVYPIEEESK